MSSLSTPPALQIMTLLGQDAALIPAAAHYLRLMSPSLLLWAGEVAVHNYFSTQVPDAFMRPVSHAQCWCKVWRTPASYAPASPAVTLNV